MKTLSDLKKTAHKYEWLLTHNSWYSTPGVASDQWRTVSAVLTNKMSLNTLINGVIKQSWIDFPKASELTIKHLGLNAYELTINRIIKADPWMDRPESVHTMIYKIRPICAEFAA
jgi:hypothetical protein